MSAGEHSSVDLSVGAAVLGRALGGPVTLEPTDGPRGRHRSAVIRCRVVAPAVDAPSTVVVKQAHAMGRGSDFPFLNEWAALVFLAQVERDPPIAPLLYAADASAGVLVMEDLGDADSLVDALLGSDAATAERGLLGLAKALGALHAASIPRLEEQRRLRLGLGPLGGEAIIPAHALAGAFADALRGYGVASSAAGDDVDRVIAQIARPGPFLALVHGDAGPGNERLRGEHVSLLDFATAGLRHCLLDGVCGQMAFPTCWCARRLPARIAKVMEEAYRGELARGCSAAADDEAYTKAVVTACAYWLIETTTVALASLPSGDSLWGTSTLGERLALRTEVFTELAADTGEFTGLAATMTRLVDALGLSDAGMPLYPAFGGPPLSPSP